MVKHEGDMVFLALRNDKMQRWHAVRSGKRASLALILLLTSLLSGCNQLGDGVQANAPRERAPLSLQHADVAFVSLEGPPEALAAHILERVKTLATAENIGQTQDFQAHYLVRGYVTAHQEPNGVALSTVWDVFNAGKQRIKRLDNNFVAMGARGDAWSVLDEASVEKLSAQMVADLEDYLQQEARSSAAPFKAEAAAPASATPTY